MKLRDLFFLYLRARIRSWIEMDTTVTYMWLNSMERCAVASFTNGRMDTTNSSFPNTVPEGWDAPPEKPTGE